MRVACSACLPERCSRFLSSSVKARSGIEYPWLNPARSMSTSIPMQSGSNKWSKIKHKKAANDAARSATYGVLSREIISAVKSFGPDPALNFRLSMLLRKARDLDIPKDKVEATLSKAAGKDGTDFQTVTYEVLGPVSNSHPPVAMMIECLTDNTRRTMASLREAFNKSGGSRLSSTAHLFDRTGYIRIEARAGATFDEVFEAAVEEGAEDVQLVEEDSDEAQTESAKQIFEIKCAPSEVHALAGLLSRDPHNHILQEAEQRMEPNGPVLCFEEEQADMSPEDAANVAGWVSEGYWDRLERMRDMIETNADCQRIFSTLQGWPPR